MWASLIFDPHCNREELEKARKWDKDVGMVCQKAYKQGTDHVKFKEHTKVPPLQFFHTTVMYRARKNLSLRSGTLIRSVLLPYSCERAPTPYFRPSFLYRIKVYSNEHPPWSKLHMANGVYLWSLRSIVSSAMHIWGKKFCVGFTEGYYKTALQIDGRI